MTSSFASTNTQKELVEKFVKKAVCYTLTEGKAKAIEAFDAEKGEFQQGNMYIFSFVYKGPEKGLNIAHGYKKDFRGKNLLDLRDPNGYYIVRNAIKISESGGGWLQYGFEEPSTGKIATKHAYILPVPGENFFVACGYYTKLQ